MLSKKVPDPFFVQSFSKELIAKGQEYFERKYEVKASEEEMDLWLDRLTALVDLVDPERDI